MNSGFDKHFKLLMKSNKRFSRDYWELFTKEPISTQIAILRRERRFTQKQLAKKLHLLQPTIARLEHKGYMPSIFTLSQIARVLHCRIALIPQD